MNKVRFKMILPVFSLLIMLSACGQTELTEPIGSVPIVEPLATQISETDPTAAAESTIPDGATSLSRQELDGMEEMLTQKTMGEDGVMPDTNWYNMATLSHYETPEQLDLWQFFSEGVGGPDKLSWQPSAEELAFLETQPQIHTNQSVYRVTRTQANEVLQKYFGMTLEEMDGVGLERLAYYPETDCFYSSIGSIMFALNIEVKEGFRLADGKIQITYQSDYREYTMTMKPVEDGYQILSNIWLNRW